MKRDDDLIRDILFRLEAEDDYLSANFVLDIGASAEQRRVYGHVLLLNDAGLVSLSGKRNEMVRLTVAGHDYIAAIREDTTWNKTKEIVRGAGGATLSMMVDISVALAKQKVREMTGLEF